MRDNVALSWNTAALGAVRQVRMGPPIVARALHVLHAAMYDAWAAHHHRALGSRLADLRRRPPAERTPQARRRRPASPPTGPWSLSSPPRRAPSPS
jgi:hypothetical protein